MSTSFLLSALARAFIADDSAPDAIVERCTRILGKPWRWLRPLALRYQKTFSPASRPRPRYSEVVGFLKDDDAFQRALRRHSKTISVPQFLADIPAMRPVAAAQNWPVPAIETAADLANWLEISVSRLEWFADHLLCYKQRNPRLRHYRYRVLQTDSNKARLIEAPKNHLKQLQQKILTELLDVVPLHDAVHGFRKGRSIRTFCEPHVGKYVVLKLDLRDFFLSISEARIQALFRTLGYPESVADMLGGICCNAVPLDIWKAVAAAQTQLAYCRPHLPQGAPSSPALANLCAYRLDCRLSALAQACGATYTRYADDLAFSGGENFAKCVDRFYIQAAAIALEEGFAVQYRKTRIMRRSVRQHIAGLVINDRPNVRRNDFDELKAILTNCARTGPAAQNRLGLPDFREHLHGRVVFVKSINPLRGEKLEKIFDRISWEFTA
jgi:hypothetical protein